MLKRITLMLFSIVFMTACSSDDDEIRAGRYGMMGEETPQYAAVMFMNAIYSDETLDQAVSLSTDRFSKILLAYYTPKTVQRQIFNLRLDSMLAEPVSGGALLLSDAQDEAEIEIKIIGEYQKNKVTELKTLLMVKVKGNWKVAKVQNTVP
ncbi:hypothetical protein [Agaribacter marinus]|uniref:Lipoprotein n=1 Tax=Agaribacter marinus TaxID=1431249 RepID=A0AA37WHH8_9ALTE|nr:hypothetical protein [Agaribacter marinus]GLR69887.1 hypothetical protein GCM10007852_07950 [Agaribacter marinus]